MTLKPVPIDKQGYGRIVKTVLLDEKKANEVLKSIKNPKIVKKNNSIVELDQVAIGTHKNKRKYDKFITVFYVETIDFGLVVLVVKEVIRTVRPDNVEMDMDIFLKDWPYTMREEFLRKNTVFIKDGILKQQFRYMVPSSLPWIDVHPQQTPEGRYIAEISFVSESLNAQLLSSLFTTHKCAHFLTYYQAIDSKDHMSHIIVQHCDASLATEARKCTLEQLDIYFLQVLVALRKMQQSFKMVHNDLFLYSIVIQRVQRYMKWNEKSIQSAKAWKYRYKKNRWFYVKPTPSIVKMSDLGFSSSFFIPGGIVRRDIWEGEKIDIGMGNTYAPQCDIMTFLNDLRVNFKCKLASVCMRMIAKEFGYKSVSKMLSSVLIPGQEFRIYPSCLKGLDAAFILDRLESLTYHAHHIQFKQFHSRVLAMEK